jgi:hypothetical protein
MSSSTKTLGRAATLALLIGVGSATTGSAVALDVTIVNPGFEDTSGQVSSNEFTFGTPLGWSIYDPLAITGDQMGLTGFWTGTLAPAGGPYFGGIVPEGLRVAIPFNLGAVGGTGVYGFEQTLEGSVLEANTRYELSVEVGNIGSGVAMSGTFFNLEGFPGYRVQLLAGDTVIAADNNMLDGAIPEQEFRTSRVTIVIGEVHASLGETLGIRLVNLNEIVSPTNPGNPFPDLEVDFDDVRLLSIPVPTLEVQKMYVAYYGRPGDPEGIGFWAGRLQESGGDLSDIINDFGTSDEFIDQYGGLANEELVNNIYLQLFGRAADPGGLEFYVGWLIDGTRSLGDIALSIADGVREGTADFDIVANKLEVANTFSAKVVECDAGYGTIEINGAKEIVNLVDSTETSVAVALGQIDAFLCQ